MENTNPRFSHYNQSECIQYLLDAAALCAKPNNESLATPLEALVQGNTKLVQAFKKDKKSNITKLLTLYDQRRDDAVVCLRMCAQAYTNHYDAETREAARIVLNTIDKYGKSLHKLNYQSETSVLSNLYTDCTSEPVASAVAKIHMSDVVEEKKTANDLFNETYLARVEESAAKDQVATGELVQEAIANYRHLVTFIEAYNTINPDGGYDTLLKQLSELAAKYNGLITTNETKEEVEEETQA
ncbi:DUF6261 family protein [Carboxylicivirga marina]|uniref:DUF6261 family protein n=1 Tax=Carboxylicivirga marina TaxID=2800988 RepID=UPI002592AD6F|nr:DUF6261 family protein [uncultured Carboxylicivirga sp.]